MLQKINFTGRVDLPMESLDAYIEKQGPRTILQLDWDFSRFSFDQKAEMWLEIRRAGSYEYRREYLSSFKKRVSSASIDVSNMTDPMNLRLRLKIVSDGNGKRLLIGTLDNFVPRVPQESSRQKGFLKIVKDDSMEIPWRMKYELGEPVLVISGKKNNYSVLKEESQFFIPAILPEVVRQVCMWAIKDRDRENLVVFSKWERFLVNLGVSPNLFERDESSEDLEDSDFTSLVEESSISCANEFSRKNGIIEIVDAAFSGHIGESDV
jgi:hypothetical protein